MSATSKTDVVILGAGAAGMMAAIEAGRRGRSVVVIDHARAPGEKIRISGGGRCNFTNLHCTPANFISSNRHFAISALKSFTQHDFIDRVKARGIAYHEKTLGQLFCDGSAREIIAMLTDDIRDAGGRLELSTDILEVRQIEGGFEINTSAGTWQAQSLVVATGGKSIPKMGATGLGYDIARQIGHVVTDTRAGLVPFTWASNMHESWGFPAFRSMFTQPATARRSTRPCCSPIAGFQARRCFRSRPTGAKVTASRSILRRAPIWRPS